MNHFVWLTWKSLRSRKLTASLTVMSLALSVVLLLSVESLKEASEKGFTQSISGVDLLVGARSSPLSLLLYSVFNVGSATQNVSWQSYQEIRSRPEVEWTIPYSLGDGHRGFRVVGTNHDFFKYYKFRGTSQIEFARGEMFNGLWDVVIGAEVAHQLKYELGMSLVLSHGVTKEVGLLDHKDKPFQVVGILKRTGTPVDRSLYVSLESIEAIHIDWKSGAQPRRGEEVKAEDIRVEDLEIQSITSFFLRTKNRFETLRLQREINAYSSEALLAVIPLAVLTELWRSLNIVEKILKLVSVMVLLVGFVAMLISLLTGLNERRREMCLLRAMGAQPWQLGVLLVFESGFLTFLGLLLGGSFSAGLIIAAKPILEREFGLYLDGALWGSTEWIYLGAAQVVGIVVGLVPAAISSKQALKDGLRI